MNPSSDTLDLHHLRQHNSGHESHPNAAAAARARIAALEDPHGPTANVDDRLLIDRQELTKHIRTEAKVHKRRLIPSRLRPVLASIATFGLLLLLFKAPVLLSQISYLHHGAPSAPVQLASQSAAIIPPDPTITIPKLNVQAPVVYDDTRDETQIETDLQNGVIHYAGTALPGQMGNSVIFGHSSNDWWEPGNYKYVFVLLDKLAPGDQFYVDYQSQRYIYQVTGSTVVEPTDLSVLNPTPTATMTLITCTPPGTSWKRLIVTANLVSNNASTAPTSSAPAAPTSLPSTEGTGFWQSMTQTIDGIGHSIASLFGGDKSSATPQQIPVAK